MLSNRRLGIARQVGESVAHSFFISMLNPKFRGPKFTWDSLYSMVDGFARTHVGLTGDFGKDQKKMEKISAEFAKYTLDRCFAESDIKQWYNLSGGNNV